jgi:purine-binding chemotaxis protein CheW
VSVGRARAATLAKDLVRVEVGEVFYALEVGRIREIVNPLPIVELPRERRFVLGVSDYRDEVVPVVDLRRFFGLPPEAPTRRTKWIILDAGDRLVGIVVDSVCDVFSSAEHRQRHVPVLDERHRERGIVSAYRHDEQLVFLLDASRLAEPAMQISSKELSYLPPEAP